MQWLQSLSLTTCTLIPWEIYFLRNGQGKANKPCLASISFAEGLSCVNCLSEGTQQCRAGWSIVCFGWMLQVWLWQCQRHSGWLAWLCFVSYGPLRLSLQIKVAFRSCPAQSSCLTIPVKVNQSKIGTGKPARVGLLCPRAACAAAASCDWCGRIRRGAAWLLALCSVFGLCCVSHTLLGGCCIPQVDKKPPCQCLSLLIIWEMRWVLWQCSCQHAQWCCICTLSSP